MRTWSGLCSPATCSSPMARLAIGHSHIDDNDPVTRHRHRHPLQCSTMTQNPICSTPSHSFATNEQARFPIKTTWRSFSPQKKKHSKGNMSPPSKETSTSNFLTASPTHLLNAPCSYRNPPHTPMRTSCSPAAKRTRPRMAAAAFR